MGNDESAEIIATMTNKAASQLAHRRNSHYVQRTNLELCNALRDCASDVDGIWSHEKRCILMLDAALRIEALAVRDDLNIQEINYLRRYDQ